MTRPQRLRVLTVDEIIAAHEEELATFRHYAANVLAGLSILALIAIIAMVTYGLTVGA